MHIVIFRNEAKDYPSVFFDPYWQDEFWTDERCECVINLDNNTFTRNGITWGRLDYNHL